MLRYFHQEIRSFFVFYNKLVMGNQFNAILFDDIHRNHLLPLTFTRPVSELRIGITTLKEKWESLLNGRCSYATVDYLAGKYPIKIQDDNLYINAAVIPDENVVKQIVDLTRDGLLMHQDRIVAFRSAVQVDLSVQGFESKFNTTAYRGELIVIRHTWDLFVLNDRILQDDFRRITRQRKSDRLSNTNSVLGADQVFAEEGVKCEYAIINATTGPVYLGRNTEIMEGSVIRGPFALCDHATLKLGTKIYGATTIGPWCKVGGEVHNSVFIGYSSKSHDGYLGDSVIGEWCNLGAGTNNSNLKNNYAIVRLWNYPDEHFIDTGLQFCGLIMGDHSKCAINTMFNTGTVVGVSANIYGSGFPRNFIPSFTWGGPGRSITYQPDKVFETARVAMARRGISLTDEDKTILLKVFDLTEKFRKKQK